ncbi:Hypothetical protein PHPALM_9036, partial [Phytophthora palmivora]
MGAWFNYVWTEYARFELLPVYIGAVIAWIVTTPLRDVVWTFFTEVWRVTRLNGGMWLDYTSRYQEVLRNPSLRQLHGLAYGYALWSTFFAVPVKSWWLAFQVTFGEYGPDLVLETCASVERYCVAWKEGCANAWRRVYGGVQGLCWAAIVTLSMIIHVPMLLFDVLEFVLCGAKGVVVALVVLNASSYYWGWTIQGLLIMQIMGVIGLATHGWHHGDRDGRLRKIAPRGIIEDAFDSAQRNASERYRAEQDSILRVKKPVVRTRVRLPVEDEVGASLSSDEEPDKDSRISVPARAQCSLVPGDFTDSDTYMVERLRGLADEVQHGVLRGRRTSSRGECPVPENKRVIPAVLDPG